MGAKTYEATCSDKLNAIQVLPETDLVDVKYIIPARELWDQYKKDYLTENKVVVESIANFENNRMLINAPDDDDLDDESIKRIYEAIAMNRKNKMNRGIL